jgi:ABC-type multidrug transport system ATPase subunit
LKNVEFEVERGSRMAIIGPNGIGKSTLLEILTGHTKPDKGEFNWGFASQAVYFPQDHGREVKGDLSLLEWLGQFDRSKTQEQLRNLLGLVLFSGDTVNQSIQTLSGGEKARLILAKMMMQMGNVLIFDEPTNHLDLEAIDELTRALQNYEGTLLLVSHNRYFVSHLADRILEIDYEGVTDFNGTYAEFVEKKERDHLAAPSTMKQRYGLDGGKDSVSTSSQYEDQKRIRSQKSQLKKKLAQIEEACHKLEETVRDLEHKMSSEGFYQQTPQEEQTKLIKKKQQLEEQLLAELEKWELTGIELQRYEEA